MNWDHLKIALTVAREGSASAAAKALAINHTTVIRRLEQLEQQLQVRLFDRLPTGYRITSQGQELIKQAKIMETAAYQVERSIKGQEVIPAGRLRVSRPEQALLDMTEVLANFHQAYPQIELDITTSGHTSDLNRLESDVALRLTNTPPELLLGRRLGRLHFAVYGSRQYLQQFDGLPKPEQCHWLVWTGARSSAVPEVNHPDRLLLECVPNANVVMRSNTVTDLSNGIRAGMGVGLLSSRQAGVDANLVQCPKLSEVY